MYNLFPSQTKVDEEVQLKSTDLVNMNNFALDETVGPYETKHPSSKRKTDKGNASFPTSNQNERKLKGMKGYEVRTILQADPIKFCQELGLVSSTVKCWCNQQMRLAPRMNSDRCIWRCRKNNHNGDLSIRKGTWFANSKLTISDILWITYMWIHEYSYISMMHETDHSARTLIDWLSACRKVCQAIMNRKCDMIGGPNVLVELFECRYSQSKKAKQCHKHFEKYSDFQWTFCAIQQFSSEVVLIIVEDHKSDTIFQIFEKYILPGTTVFSTIWNAYSQLNKKDFEVLVSEKFITFYDSVLKKNIDSFEDFKEITKRQIPEDQDLEYDALFCESMYRKSLSFAPDAYLTFLRDIGKIFIPCDKIPSTK